MLHLDPTGRLVKSRQNFSIFTGGDMVIEIPTMKPSVPLLRATQHVNAGVSKHRLKIGGTRKQLKLLKYPKQVKNPSSLVG
jgi:hypothetical protein